MEVNDFNLLGKLSAGDMAALKNQYDKLCLVALYARSRQQQKKQTSSSTGILVRSDLERLPLSSGCCDTFLAVSRNTRKGRQIAVLSIITVFALFSMNGSLIQQNLSLLQVNILTNANFFHANNRVISELLKGPISSRGVSSRKNFKVVFG